jgi:carboxypeptidase Q
VGELVGRDTPEELVLVSGHIDSWDVGQGAHDDGAGVVMAMETLSTLRRLRMRPRRTIRAVLWTNEENGFAGVKSYVKSHAKELPLHAAAIEADAGGFAPDAFGVHLDDPEAQARAVAQLGAILRRIARVGIMSIRPGSSAPDVGFFHGHGVAALGLYTYGENYFDYHHTEADTVDKVDPEELTRSTAAMVAVAWVLAEMPGRLGDPNPF